MFMTCLLELTISVLLVWAVGKHAVVLIRCVHCRQLWCVTRMARLHYEMGKYEKAAEKYEQALALNIDHSGSEHCCDCFTERLTELFDLWLTD